MYEKKLELTLEAKEVASLFMEMQDWQQQMAEGHPLSDTAEAERRRVKKMMEHLFRATLIFEEDKIEVKKAKELIGVYREIRYLPEFEADKKKEEALFHWLRVVFRFRVSDSSISKYYYTKE